MAYFQIIQKLSTQGMARLLGMCDQYNVPRSSIRITVEGISVPHRIYVRAINEGLK